MAENVKRSCTKRPFGVLPDGRAVDIFTLTNSSGMIVAITTYGATVVSIQVPDKNGETGDVALGFDTLEGYLQEGNQFIGATIGRFANRIARGKFTLNGKEYTLAINNGVNHLHGGPLGFDRVLWSAEDPVDRNDAKVTMTYQSPDGEEGYPGNMNVSVTFTLTDENELRFDYTAVSDADTLVNLTNHSYFNLNGEGSILGHQLRLNASKYTPIDETSIPFGSIDSVTGTPFDFTQSAAIGDRIDDPDDGQIKNGCGYDHNFVCDTDGGLSKIATVHSPDTGRVLDVLTTEPGVQFYSGNFLNGTLTGKQGIVYRKRNGFCLETQHFPDSPNQPSFPDTTLKANEKFTSTTIYRFSVSEEMP